MSLYRKTQNLKAQIVDTERLLQLVAGHPLMSEGLAERLNTLKVQLAQLPETEIEPKVQLLFSGKAVVGSHGIKSNFVSKTITPFQEMIKIQVALLRYGSVGKRGKAKEGANTELYLTALPVGSFGVELSQLANNDLFDSMDVSNAIKDVMKMIEITAKDDASFEAYAETTPKRNLTNLRKFLHEIAEEDSVLKMESGGIGIELSKEKVAEAYERVSSASDEESDEFISAIFRGLLLDSGRFEVQVDDGRKISGFLSDDLSEEQLVEYDQTFLNQICRIHLKIYKTHFKTGNEKVEYELVEISSI